MAKDKDKELIDRMNSSLTEDFQQMLEKVLGSQLKPILARLESLEAVQKKQSKAIKKLQTTLDLAIRVIDKDIYRLKKRITKIEDHLGMEQI